MNIQELDSYNLADAVKFHDRLNPRLWDSSEHLRPKVHARLMEIARDFQEFLGVPDLDVVDITISGSNAAYTYTAKSDIDLHLVVRVPDVTHDEVYRELFNAKKYQYNDEHHIVIGGADVELYAQDHAQAHHSQGIYSLLNNDWVSVPQRHRAQLDDMSIRNKFDDLAARIDETIKTHNYQRMSHLVAKIKSMRQTGLEQQGEFGVDNIAYKLLRNRGYIQRLYQAKNAARDAELSLAEQNKPRERVRYGFSESPDGVNPTTKMFLESNNESTVHQFISYVCDRLGITRLPEILLHTDPAWSEQTQSFGRYTPETHTLEVNLANRHIMDILRTVAHELVHCRQNQQHKLPDSAGDTGSDWENQANALAGVIMRDYADDHAEKFAADSVTEATGYIPKNKREAQDPRFSMAITQDVHPGQVGKEANKMALHTGKNGEPTLLMKTVNLRESAEHLSDLDRTLQHCIQMIAQGQKKDAERYGQVAACLIDSQGRHTYAINLPGPDGTRRHAERVAISKHLKRYKSIGPGAVMVTTLSPCVHDMHERYGESCTDLLAQAGIERCYAGYQDPTQHPDVDYPFELAVTDNPDIFNACKQIAQSFLPKVIAQDNTGDQLAEAFNQPYPLTWQRGESGIDAYTKLPDGTPLEINFSDEYDGEGNEITHVEFHRSHRQNVTGEGDAQKIFATVLAAIQQFIRDESPEIIMFGADKEPGASRLDLYQRLVDRFARSMGYQVSTTEAGTFTFFRLTRKFGLKENFADGRNPEHKGDSKRYHVPTKASVSTLRKVAKQGGRRGQLAHWMANMKAGRAKARRKHTEDLDEARTNPEQNLKWGSGKYELAAAAESIRDLSNWGVSMTLLPKLGIKPQPGVSEDTPKGIYFYPLDYFLNMTKNKKRLPWGDDLPYMQLFQYDTSHVMTPETKVPFEDMKRALSEYGVTDSDIQDTIDEPGMSRRGGINNPLWFIYDALGKQFTNDERRIIVWNKILRNLGFTVLFDNGKSWIAFGEPYQGCVLDIRAIKQHKTFTNYVQGDRLSMKQLSDAVYWNTTHLKAATNIRQQLSSQVAKEMLSQYLGMSKQEAKQNGFDEAIKKAVARVGELLNSPKESVEITELKINNQSGVGAVPYNAEIDYHGLQVAMKPSVFLSLALPLNINDPEERKAIEYCKSQKDQTGFGAPFLTIQVPEEWETGDFDQAARVKGHDGRHRCYAIMETEGDHAIEVHLILRGFRRRHITDHMIDHLREGMVNQQGKYTTGPLFGEAK